MKEQNTISEKTLMIQSYLPDKELKVIVIMVLTKSGRKIDEHNENPNKEL